MRRVLLIADLEGITGVDSIDALAAGSPLYLAAAERMTEEVGWVARLLLERGVESIVISDAHRSGADTNLDASRLPPGCEVRVTDDLYGGPLLDQVDAVVCVGMHAAGSSNGFGAHTVSVNTAWTLGHTELSETHVARLLAAERGVPMWFSSGDDVLEQTLDVPFVRTKRALSRAEAESRPLQEVQAGFEEVLRGPVALIPPVPRAPLRLRFQRILEADQAERAGGRRVSAVEIELAPGQTFRAQYDEALRLSSAAEEMLLTRVEGEPGTARFAASATRLLLEPWEE